MACIIIEPIMGNSPGILPKPGYLELIRKLCDEYGFVLIFDEIKTGFRVASGIVVHVRYPAQKNNLFLYETNHDKKNKII